MLLFVRLRLNTLQLVGVKRKSRQRGCEDLHFEVWYFYIEINNVDKMIALWYFKRSKK